MDGGQIRNREKVAKKTWKRKRYQAARGEKNDQLLDHCGKKGGTKNAIGVRSGCAGLGVKK